MSREPDIWRIPVTPDLAVVVEQGGAGIVLEVTDGLAGHVLRRVTITNVAAFKAGLNGALQAQHEAQAAAEEKRRERAREIGRRTYRKGTAYRIGYSVKGSRFEVTGTYGGKTVNGLHIFQPDEGEPVLLSRESIATSHEIMEGTDEPAC